MPDWNLELTIAARTLVAAILGAIIGFDRQRHSYEAGMRTYAAVSLGAAAFAAISIHLPAMVDPESVARTDPSRIAASIVGAIGFLGAGVILRDKGRVKGLTTAATLWATASVGMAAGCGMYVLAIILTIAVTGILLTHHLKKSHISEEPNTNQDNSSN